MASTQPVNAPILQFINFSFCYADGVKALEGIDFSVETGASTALIGPNGAGKSTLLLCAAGIIQGKGDILIGGESLTPRNARRLRRKLALVFQDPDDQLFMPTLAEDVAFGPINLGLSKEETAARVKEALSSVKLTEKAERPPHHLSFGEKRLGAIATALSMRADILLLDEPTSNLDPATRSELIEYLSKLPATKIIATHDLDLADRLCQRCVLLSGGHQVACGTNEEILNNVTLLRENRLAS